MLDSTTFDQVKKYNESLKQYRAKSAQLTAEIEYINKEINDLCTELTTELGVTVNKDNIEQICKEQSEKIINSLQSGNAILAKIASEEQNMNTPVQTTPVQSMNVQAAPVQATPVQATPVSTAQPLIQPAPAPIQGNVFNGQNTVLPNTESGSTLPPLFKLG